MRDIGSQESRLDPFANFIIIFEAAKIDIRGHITLSNIMPEDLVQQIFQDGEMGQNY